MRIVDSAKALEGRNRIARYIARQFGANAVREFRASYKEARKILLEYPNVGAIDWMFSNEQVVYRYLIIGNLSKMLYRVDGEIIYIIDFWDTRHSAPTSI